MAALRDEVLGLTVSLSHEDVPVPEWRGRVVRIPQVDALERLDLMDSVRGEEPEPAAEGEEPAKPRRKSSREALLESAKIVARVAREPEGGARAFGDADAEMLARRWPRVVDRLLNAFMRINEIGAEAAKSAEGKSGEAASAAPPTGSP